MRAKKRFGQNFLQDTYVIQEIIRLAEFNPQSRLLEIGPGRGALTQHLCKIDPSLIVVELDRDLIQGLESLLPDSATILQQDALELDLSTLHPSLFLIGNLPYNISTPLLLRMLGQIHHIERMVFMFQREVVDRLIASPGTKAYGRLSVVTQLKCRAELAIEVPPHAFWPVPKVDSAVIVLDPIPESARLRFDEKALLDILSSAFNQRRKTLRNSLKSIVSADDLDSLGIDPNARAETLSPDTYASLSLHVAGTPRVDEN